MGEKISILIIDKVYDKVYDKPFTNLTKQIGLGDSKIIETALMGDFVYAFHPQIRMGYYQGKTLILYNELIAEFFYQEPGELEQRLCKVFHNCLILLLIYHENGNKRGFSLINNGKRIRTKFVEFYEGTLLDYGPKLEEEKANRFGKVWSLSSKRIIGKEFLDEIGNVNQELGLENVEMVTLELTSESASS